MELTVVLSDAQVEAIAERAAELVREPLVELAPTSPYMTVREAADYWRSTQASVHDLLRRGKLQRHKAGSKVLLLRREVEAYVVPERVAHVLPIGSRRGSASGVAR